MEQHQGMPRLTGLTDGHERVPTRPHTMPAALSTQAAAPHSNASSSVNPYADHKSTSPEPFRRQPPSTQAVLHPTPAHGNPSARPHATQAAQATLATSPQSQGFPPQAQPTPILSRIPSQDTRSNRVLNFGESAPRSGADGGPWPGVNQPPLYGDLQHGNPSSFRDFLSHPQHSTSSSAMGPNATNAINDLLPSAFPFSFDESQLPGISNTPPSFGAPAELTELPSPPNQEAASRQLEYATDRPATAPPTIPTIPATAAFATTTTTPPTPSSFSPYASALMTGPATQRVTPDTGENTNARSNDAGDHDDNNRDEEGDDHDWEDCDDDDDDDDENNDHNNGGAEDDRAVSRQMHAVLQARRHLKRLQRGARRWLDITHVMSLLPSEADMTRLQHVLARGITLNDTDTRALSRSTFTRIRRRMKQTYQLLSRLRHLFGLSRRRDQNCKAQRKHRGQN